MTNVNIGLPLSTSQKSKTFETDPYQQQKAKIDDRRFIPKPYLETAQNIEQQFAEYMLNEMNKSIAKSESDSAPGADYYEALKTTEQAKIMASQNQLGLQNVILDQIYPKRMRNEMALRQYEMQAERIFRQKPAIVKADKFDTIEMGKNDSNPNETGGLK